MTGCKITVKLIITQANNALIIKSSLIVCQGGQVWTKTLVKLFTMYF